MMNRYLKNKKVLKNCHLYTTLQTYAKKRHLSFHTPGHKVGKWDITELSFSDNLSSPKGVLATVQKEIASLCGAHVAFLLTDGSTSGVFAMLYALSKKGAKTVAFPDDAHKSVHNACHVLNLTGIPFSRQEELPALIKRVDGVLLTSPSYYGTVPNLQAIANICHEQNIPLLIDGAHGGHLKNTPFYAGNFADLWVDGVHKSLPALTQGAIVFSKTDAFANELQEGVDIFRTTSPSYLIMASIEYAVKYPENKRLEENVRAFASKYSQVFVQEDWTKVCVQFGKDAFAIDKTLQKKGVYSEFCDGNCILFYLSPSTTKKQWNALKKTLEKLFLAYPFNANERIPAPVFFQKQGEVEWVLAQDAIGRISAKNCGLFPPCTPLFHVGERIEEEKLKRLLKADNVFGLVDGKMCVYKE